LIVFVDTSALFAALDASDRNNARSQEIWRDLARRGDRPVTTNYVILETIALIQRRLGLSAVRSFLTDFAPRLSISWIDEAVHQQAVAALLAVGQRDLSLVDCVSFVLMRRDAIDAAFAFDEHFIHQGFLCL
jgi:predicted nucleic acid-binding protein